MPELWTSDRERFDASISQKSQEFRDFSPFVVTTPKTHSTLIEDATEVPPQPSTIRVSFFLEQGKEVRGSHLWSLQWIAPALDAAHGEGGMNGRRSGISQAHLRAFQHPRPGDRAGRPARGCHVGQWDGRRTRSRTGWSAQLLDAPVGNGRSARHPHCLLDQPKWGGRSRSPSEQVPCVMWRRSGTAFGLWVPSHRPAEYSTDSLVLLIFCRLSLSNLEGGSRSASRALRPVFMAARRIEPFLRTSQPLLPRRTTKNLFEARGCYPDDR